MSSTNIFSGAELKCLRLCSQNPVYGANRHRRYRRCLRCCDCGQHGKPGQNSQELRFYCADLKDTLQKSFESLTGRF